MNERKLSASILADYDRWLRRGRADRVVRPYRVQGKKTGRPKANTHKDNNKIPPRAKEVLPGNRKDFSFDQKSAGLRFGALQ